MKYKVVAGRGFVGRGLFLLLTVVAVAILPTSAFANPTTTTIAVEWDKVTTNVDNTPADDVAGYEVFYKISGGSFTSGKTINDQNITQATLDGLTPGTTYTLKVHTFDTAVPPNVSPSSNEITVTTQSNNGGGDNGDDNNGDAADADSDGLSDADEATHGTDPNKADTDGDLVNDGQEIADGSNPLDKGSHDKKFADETCLAANNFINQFGFGEFTNNDSEAIDVAWRLLLSDGSQIDEGTFNLDSGIKRDLDVHSRMPRDTTGSLCFSHTGKKGQGILSSKMVNYIPNPSTLNTPFGSQAAIVQEGLTEIPGAKYVTFNTYPLNDPAQSFKASWVLTKNLSKTESCDVRLYAYGMDGVALNAEEGELIQLGPDETKEYPAHQFGRNLVGHLKAVPQDGCTITLSNAVYEYDNAQLISSFTTATRIAGMVPTGVPQMVFLDTRNGKMAVLEVVNTLNEAITATVKLNDVSTGELLATIELTEELLGARKAFHIIANTLVGAGKNLVATITPNKLNSVIAVGMLYKMSASNAHLYSVVSPAMEALGTVRNADWNSFIGHTTRALVASRVSDSRNINMTMRQWDGSALINGQSESLPATGGIERILSDFAEADRYGSFSIQAEGSNARFVGAVVGAITRGYENALTGDGYEIILQMR